MAKEKKPTRYLTGKVEMKATFSQLRDKKEKRGPGQLGQQRDLFTAHLGRISQPQLKVRLAAAKSVLETGKVPKAVKGGAPATADATLAKMKEKLEGAAKTIEGQKATIAELEARIPQADPVPDETPTPEAETPPEAAPEPSDPVEPAPSE